MFQDLKIENLYVWESLINYKLRNSLALWKKSSIAVFHRQFQTAKLLPNFFYLNILPRIPNIWAVQVSASFETKIAHHGMNYASKITIIIDEFHWKTQGLNEFT